MKISCQNCSSKYTVSDEKVQGKTVKLKCKKCGATILVNAGGATTVAGGAGVADHASSPSDAPSTDSTSYMVNVAEGDQRTMSIAEIVAAYQSQVVTADTYVWADGMADWQPLGQVEAIVSALNGGAPAAPAVAPSTPPAAMPMAAASSAETAASAASLAASASRAAATRQGGAKRADVFGSEKSDDVATSAPLFSASARAAASNAAAAARPSQQREENSVLFSLSALTSKAATATPAPTPSRKDSREDSGLIDLRALAAAAAPAAPSPSVPAPALGIGGDDAGLFPLGVPASAPAAPPVATPVVQPPPASKAPMFIGIGALLAAIAIVGVFFAMKGDDKPVTDAGATTATTPAAQPTPEVTATATPTPEATATATASATATATATATAAVASAPKGTIKTGGTTTKPSTGTSGGSSGAATKPTSGGASSPPKSKCNCAPSDLMCNMKCSAGGK